MKRIVSICSAVIVILCGCIHTEVPEIPNESSPVSIESINIVQLLHLQDRQEYDVFDYRDNMVLLLISDSTKQNSLDINDQVMTTYYETFILFDLSTKAVVAQYPLQQFGICTSALSVFNGVMFFFFTTNSIGKFNLSIYFLNDKDMQSVYQGDFTPFGMGPVLHHHDNAVLFTSPCPRIRKSMGLTLPKTLPTILPL